MTRPRPVLPGATYLITRRCTQRQFLLKPTDQINSLVAYAIAYAAERTGVAIHALCVMSNHYHAVVSDPEARIPEFQREAHRLISKSVNCAHGRWENLWATGNPSRVVLEDVSDVLDKITYTMTNPVQAGLVAHGRKWPGLRSGFGDEAQVIELPATYYSKVGSMPKRVTLQMSRPPILLDQTDEEIAARVARDVWTRENLIRDQHSMEGRKFVGCSAVRRQHAFGRPRQRERRRSLSPRVAAKNKWQRIEAIRRNREFEDAYRTARELWSAGFRDVVFPPGTYYLRIHAGVVCASRLPQVSTA